MADLFDSADQLLGRNPGARRPPAITESDEPSFAGEVSKGFSRGLRHEGGNIANAAGLGAEALGFNEAAAKLRGIGGGLREAAMAPEFAPEAATWSDAKGLGQSVRWLGGKVGEMGPVVGEAVAGGVVGGPMLGPIAAMTPGQVGLVDEGQQANPAIAAQPVADRGLRALGGGVGMATAMNLPIGSALGRVGLGGIADRAVTSSLAGTALRTVGEGAVTGGLGMGTADVIGQKAVDPTAPLNLDQTEEAAIGGAVTVGAMHVPGIIPSYLRGQGADIGKSVTGAYDGVKQSINERLAARKAAETEAVDSSAAAQDAANAAAGKKVGSLWDDAVNFMNRSKDTSAETAEKVAKGEPVGYTNEEMASATPETAWEMLQRNKKAATDWAKEAGTEMLNKAGIDEAKRAELKQWVENAADPVAQKGIAAMHMAEKAADDAGKKISGLWDTVKKGYGDAKAEAGTKKSEDTSGAEMAILKGLKDSGIMKRRPDIFGTKLSMAERKVSNDKINQMAESLRLIVENMHKGPINSDVIAKAIDVFGDDTFPVINSVMSAIKKSDLNPAETEQMFTNLNKMDIAHKAAKTVRQAIINSGTDEMRSQNFRELNDLEKLLTRHAEGALAPKGGFKRAGEGERSAEDIATEAKINDIYTERFGKKADVVRKAVQEAVKATKGEEHTGPREFNDDGSEVPLPKDKVPQGQTPLYDQNGNRLEAEDLDTMRFGLTAPDKNGRAKMRRNGRMYPSPESLDEGARYTRQHLLDLKAKYPDKQVEWEPNEEGTHGHITVKERLNPEDVSDETIDKMRLNTKKYPKSESRMEFNTGEVTEKGEPKPLILDTMAVSREMGARNPQGSVEGDLTYAHRLSRQFMDGISALASKFGVMPHVPDTAVIGYVGGEKFTWGMAQKMRKTRIADDFLDADRQQLHDMTVELRQATLSQASLAKMGLTQKNLSPERIKELKKEIKFISDGIEFEKNRELSHDEYAPSERAAAAARFAKKGEMGMKGPLDERSTAYDKEGRLTQDGLRMMMAGDYHGGIEVGRSSSRAEEADRISGGARFDNMEFDGGTGQTQIGKDAQVHTAFAGGKDDAYFGGAHEGSRPQQENNVVRANQDGSSHFVSDRWNHAQKMAAMGHELMAKSSAAAKALGDKIVKLTAPDVMARMNDVAMDDMIKATLPGLTVSSRAALVNKLAEHFLKPVEERVVSYKERTGAVRGDKTRIESEVDYNSRDIANRSLLSHVEGMSDNMAQYELRRRERLLAKATPGSDWHDMISSEVRLLQERLANGRDESGGDAGLQFQYDGGTQQNPVGTIGAAGDMHGMARADSRVRFSSVGEDPGTSRMEVAPGQAGDGGRTDNTFTALDNPKYKESSPQSEMFPLQNNRGAPNPKELAAKKAALLEAASSSDPKLHQELATSSDAKGLQRAIDTLTAKAPNSEALKIANARMAELIKDPAVAYALQTRKYSMDSTKVDAKDTTSPEFRKSVEDHITKVLGPKVKVAWTELSDMPYAGDYNHQQKLIRLSVHALDPMGTGFHESMHSFIASMKDAGAKDVAEVLERAASSRVVIEQLHNIYKDRPEVLKQLANAEERAAYMYQHWALDKGFTVPVGGQGVLGRIAKFIRNLLGTWTNDERAVHIMKYFHQGEFAKNSDKPNFVRRQLMEVHRNEIAEKAKEFTQPLADMADAVVTAGGARVRETGIPALGELADLIKRQHTDSRGGDRGFTQASRIQITKRMGDLGDRLGENASRPDVLQTALTHLQTGEWGKDTTPEQRLAARPVVKEIKNILRETHEYMTEAGVDIGDLGRDYFPREWDTHYISKNMQAFRDMLEPYKRSGKMKGEVDTLIKNLMTQGGSEIGIEGRGGFETKEPGMQFKKQRVLDFIDPRDAAEFQKKDLMGTMSSYITQASRKAEWTRRLGGGKLEALMERARTEGATQEHLNLAEDYLKANDGTLGDNLNPTARRLMGNMIVYQNVRLLPMASFSMLIDPLGTVVRGAKAGEAWKTFKRGMAGVIDTFKKEGSIPRDEATQFAELVGVVDNAMMSHAMSDVYTQGMVGGTAKDINNTFFKYNFVEGLNRNFRIGATESAMKFIQRHADGKTSEHSTRWINELGLQKGDIQTHEGRLALTQAEGLTAAQETRVHAAINQWVDGAILRPDAADKPIWMNDPHFALIAHLKQFVYSFQHTILDRVSHEMSHGNYQPIMALGSYLPVMMAADFTKNFIVNGGGQPDWQKGWDMWDYIENGMERSGFFGVGQFGVDVAKNIHRGGTGAFALAGPTIEQLRDSVEMLGGHKQFSTVAIDALPANALYKPALGAEGKADPIFAE